ncbi:MAG: LysR family transcriptional regulator [Heyndrickxia sp.]
MDIEGLESFLTVANKKSISKAAAALHITQPTLSTRIRKLEDHLGFPLLERSWEGASLSHQGDYFLPYAIQFLRELGYVSTVITDFEELLSTSTVVNDNVPYHQKSIRIGMNAWLAPVFTNAILMELDHHFPQLNYQFFTKPTDTLKDLLEYNGIDLAIFYQNERKTELCSRKLMDDEMVLLCAEEDWDSIGRDIDHLEMLSKPFILFDNPVIANNTRLINSIREKFNITKYQIVDSIFVMNSFISLKKGYTIMPRISLSQIPNLSSLPITMIPLADNALSAPVYMEYNSSSSFIQPIKLIEQKLENMDTVPLFL